MNYLRKNRFLPSLLLVLYLSNILFYTPTLADELEVDSHAPASQQPTIEVATNGIPIINITEPSPGGVSRNTFTEYNVAEQGIIFNNNPDVQPENLDANKSYLTKEPLFPNANLQGRAAEVILTEVTGVHASNLLGPTELYGHRADFILANPHGIYCNGANFINANRVTLTTGQPVFDPQKALQQLHVKKGTIQIVGHGIQTKELEDLQIPTSPLEILSKVIEINGTLQHSASDVYLYGGEQSFTYQNKQFTLQPSTKSQPIHKYIAVDANLLGNIQANKIYIIATQQGVGVNTPKLLAKEEIVLTASGDIRLKEIHTNKDLYVTSKDGDIQQEGDKTIVVVDYHLEAEKGNIILDTPHLQMGGKGQLISKQLTITPRTKLWAQGIAHDHPTLALRVSDKFNNQGHINVTQLVASPLKELTNTGNLITQGSLELVSQQIHHSGEIATRKGDIHLTGHQQITNQGLILSQQGKLDLQGGAIHNTGKLSTKEQLTLSATTLEQQGTIEGKEVKLVVQGAWKNSKDIYSQGELAITSGPFHNTGELKSDKQLDLAASSLEQQGTIKGKGVKLFVQGTLQNHQHIYSQGELAITSGPLYNTGELKGEEQLTLTTSSLEQAGLITGKGVRLSIQGAWKNSKEIASQGELHIISGPFHNQGKVVSANHLTLHSPSLDNKGILHTQQGDITLQVQDIFTNTKEISSKMGHVTVKGLAHITNQGTMRAYQDLAVEAGELANHQTIQAKNGKATLQLAQKLTNQLGAKITGSKELSLQVDEVINQGDITSKEAIDLTVSNLLNKPEGAIQAAHWKAEPFQQLTNEGNLAITHDINLVTEQLTNTGVLSSQQGKMELKVKQDLVNQQEIISQGAYVLQVGGKLTNTGILASQQEGMRIQVEQDLVNEKEIKSRDAQILHVAGKLTNQGSILAKKEQTIIAAQLDNVGILLSQEGSSTLQVTQQLDNIGKIRSHQAQEIQAAALTNQGEIASEAGPVTIRLEQDLKNESTVHTPTHLTIAAKSLTNTQKIFAGGTGKITLTGQLTNDLAITSHQDLEIEALEVTNSGEIQSQIGSIILVAHQQLTNKNLIGSQKDLTLQTAILRNQGSGKLYTDQVLHLNNSHQLINAGEVMATTIQQVGSPIWENQGLLQATTDLTLAVESLQNTGKIQVNQGRLTIHSNQQITQEKGALLHGQQGMTLTADGAITNVGTLQTEQGELAVTAARLTNEGQVLGPSISLTTTQGPLTNYQAIKSKTGNITLKTKDYLINKGQVVAHQDLLIKAGEVANHQTIQATNGKATLQLAQKLTNQLGAKITGSKELSLQVDEVINQGDITSKEVIDLAVSNLLNKPEGVLRAAHWKAEPFRQLTNEGNLAITHDIKLVTDQLTNTGNLVSQQGDMKLEVKQDLVNQQEITSQGAHVLQVGGNLINKGILASQQGRMRIQVDQDLVNEQEIKSEDAQILHVAGKLINQGTILAKKEQTITANQLNNIGTLLSQAGSSMLQVTQQLDNAGKIRSHQVQEIQAAALTNRGEIASEAGPVTIRLEQALHNEATLRTPTNLTIQAKSLTNTQKIFAGGTGKITLTGQLTNDLAITSHQDLEIQAAEVTNSGEIQSQEGSIILVAHQQLINNNLIASKKGLTLQTSILRNQGSGKLYTDQVLHLNNSQQLINAGEVMATTIQQVGSPIWENQGLLQATTDLTLAVESLQNTGKIQVNQGSLTIHSNQQITQEKGALLYGQKGMALTADGAIINVGTLQTEQGDLAVTAARLTNEGQVLAPSISLTTTQGPLINYQAIKSKTGSIALKTPGQLINQGQVEAHQDLTVAAGEVANHQTIQAKNGKTTLQLAQKLTNQLGAKITGSKKLSLQVDEVINQGDITSKEAIDLTVSNLLNKPEGVIQAAHWKSRPFQQLTNAGIITTSNSIDLVTDKFTNTGTLTSQQGGMKLQVNQDLINQQEISSQGAQLLQVGGKLTNTGILSSQQGDMELKVKQELVNEQEIKSQGAQNLHVGGKLTNQGTILAKKEQTIIAAQLDNVGILLSQEGSSTLQVTQQLDNTGKIRSHQAQEIRAAGLTNQGEIASEAGSLTITVEQALQNEATLRTPTNLTIAARSLTNTQKIYAGGTGKITLTGQLTNDLAITSNQDLEIQALEVTNSGEIQSQEGSIILVAHQQLTNKNLIGSQKYLTLQTAILRNQGSGKLYTDQVLHLNNSHQLINAGEVMATTIQQVGSPIWENQGLLQATTDLTLAVESLQNTGKIQVNQGSLTIHSNQQITQEKGALLHGQKGMTLTADGAITNVGTLQTEQGELAVTAARLTNEGQVLGPSISLTTTQGPLANYQAIHSKIGSITLKTPGSLVNRGQVEAHQDLAVAAGEVENHQTMQATTGKATFQLTKQLTNQSGAKMASKQDMTLQASEVMNQGKIISKAALDLAINKLSNTGTLQAVHWRSQSFQQVSNAGILKIFHGIDLTTDRLTNTGKLISQQGGMNLHIHQDLENQQEIISQGAQNVVVGRNMTNTGTLKGAALKLHVHQDLINEKDLLAKQTINLEVTGKLTNRGHVQSNEKQDLTAGDIANEGEFHSSAMLTLKSKQHIHHTGNIQGGGRIELTSNTFTNTPTGLIQSNAHTRITTQGTLENLGRIAAKQAIELTSLAGAVSNTGTVHAEQEARLTAQGDITNRGTLVGQKLEVKTGAGQFTNEGTLQPVGELRIQAKDILNNREISAEAATLQLTATHKLTNNQPIKSKTGSIQFKSQQLDNHSEIASGSQLTVDTRQLTNHRGAALISHQKLSLSNMVQVDNAGKIDANNLVHTGIPVFINRAQGELQTHSTTLLNTQNFTNQGTITVIQGDLTVQSQEDITQEKGKITTQQGHMTLQALAGKMTNQGDITSSHNIQVQVGKTLQNDALLGAKSNLTIQAHTFNNGGKVKAVGTTTLTLTSKLHNKNKITSGGNLTIGQGQGSLELLNEGTLESTSTLDIHARQLNNPGNLQAQVGKLVLTDGLLNIRNIQAAGTLTLTAGKLNNSGEIGANQALVITVQQGDVENRGTIVSSLSKVTLKVQTGGLYNTHELKSKEGLEIDVARALHNDQQGKLMAEELLTLTASSVHNQGAISSKGKAILTITTGDLINRGTIGSWDDLTLTIDKQLDNQAQGKIATIVGGLTLTAQEIYNKGAMNPGKGKSTLLAQEGTFYQHGTIKAGGALTIKAGKRIENRGVVLAEQNLALEAPIIEHYHQLQSNEGDLIVKAMQLIKNAGKLISFKQLRLDTQRLENHADLGSDKDLTLHIPEIENTQRISARGKLDLHVTTLINRGEILGGQGKNLIEVKKLLTNYNKIATLGPLTLEASPNPNDAGNLEVVNHGELIANQTLAIRASALSNTYLIQGGGPSSIKITGEILNRGMIASLGDLDIQASRISHEVDRFVGLNPIKLFSGTAPYEKGFYEESVPMAKELKYRRTILANGIITLQAGELIGNDMLAGKGDKDAVSTITLTEGQEIHQRNVIHSAGDLTWKLRAEQKLHNHHQILVNGALTIEGGREIYNHERGLIQGGIVRTEFNKGGYGDQRIVNQGTFMGLQKLYLTVPRGSIVNEARLQAETLLHINTGEFYNKPSASTLSGGEMLLQASHINNDQGEIFANGNMTLEGQNEGVAERITNTTGDKKKARIEATKDITIKAKKLENRGYVTSWDYDIDPQYSNIQVSRRASKSWVEVSTTYGKYWFSSNERDGDLDFYFREVERRTPTSRACTSLAHINAQGNLTLVSIKEVDNYGGTLTAGEKLSITNENGFASSFQKPIDKNNSTVNGTHIKNITPSKSVYISDAHKYEKRWKNWGCNLWRVYRKSETFTIESNDKSLIRGGSETIIEVKTLENGIEIPKGEVAACEDPFEKIQGNGLLDMDNFQLPEGEHGLFVVQVDPNVSVDNHQVKTPQIQASSFQLPTLASSGFEKVAIEVDQALAEELAPSHYTMADIQQALAPEVSSVTTEELGALPISSTTINLQTTHQRQTLSEDTDTSYDLPRGTVHQEKKIQLAPVTIEQLTALPISSSGTSLRVIPQEKPLSGESDNLPRGTVYQEAKRQLTPITTEKLAPLPVASSTISLQTTHQRQTLSEDTDTSYDLPRGTIHQEKKRELAQDSIAYQAAPPIEKVQFTCLPSLVRSTLAVDQSRFYGSPYFLRHVGLDPGQRGTPANPLRFLGDPFYESRIIHEAIQKATARQLLYEDVATPEEQIKVLIDNTAAVAKDLQVGLGVSLSKEQINNLKKDILWYEEKTVKGQKVLVPQIYLTKETISNLRSQPSGGIRSGGKMVLNVQEKLTNTGVMSAQDEMTIRAQSLHNESFGNTQALIQSTKGSVDLVTQKNIDNISGKISGATATQVISQEGAIHNTTKLLNESDLHMQASIESGGNLTMQAKGDIVNTAAKVKASGDAVIQSETGDLKFLTQTVKTTTTTSSSSTKNGFFNSSHSNSTTTRTKTEHAVSELEIGGNATLKGRDLTFMGTKATVDQDMKLDASRDIHALAVRDLEETTTTSVEHQKKRGLFTSKSTTKTHSSTHRESTSKGIDFQVGGTLGAKAGRNADFEGANVTAKNVKMDVKGETILRNAYDETTHEERSSVDNKNEACLGLFKDNNGKSSHSKSYDKKAMGNTWKVAEKFEVTGVGNVTTQAINLEAHQFKIESTQGNVYDKAAEEVHEQAQEVRTYSERQGLLVGNKEDLQWKGQEGRVSMKLREKKEETTQTKDNNTKAHSSSFKTHAKVVKTADGKEEIIQGDGTFKGAKTVVLEGTETDLQGKLSLQGKEGVAIIAKKETEKQEKHTETYTEELSLGVKNSIVAAAHQGKAVKEALEAEVKAMSAYSNYKDQLKQAEKLYKSGQLTEGDYQAVKEEEKYHLASTAAATLAVAHKTKQFLSSAANAMKTAGSTAGFSIDLQADINKTVDQFMSYGEKAKGSKIKTQALEVITEKTFQVIGSQIDSGATEITAKDMEVKSFVGKQHRESSGHSKGGNVTVDTNLSLEVSLSGETRSGQSKGVQHTHSQLNLGKTKLNIEKDLSIQGQMKTTTVEGKVGGDIRVETVVDTNQGAHTTVGGNIGFGISPGQVKASGGASFGQGKQDDKRATLQSGFTSEAEFKVEVGGKTYLKAAAIGSEQADKTDLQTQEIIQENVDTYQRSSDWGVSASGNVSQSSGASEANRGGKADIYYHRSHARQKLVSSVGAGNKGPINYLDTQSEMKVDSEMVEMAYDLATDPGKVGKEVRDDLITVGLGGRAVLAGIVNVGKTGVVGAVEVIQRGLAATGGVIELTKRENEEGELAQAAGAKEFEKALNTEAEQVQKQLGVKDIAKVKLYQGESNELQGTGHNENNASFDEKGNTINYNTSRKDFKKVETIADDLAHESTHKAISETKYAKHLINNDQEEVIAKIVGKQARQVAKAFKDEDSSTRSSDTTPTNHIEWNKKNREALKANNEELKGVKVDEVKASAWLLGNGSVYAGKMTILEELKQNQQLREDLGKVLEDSGAKAKLGQLVENLKEQGLDERIPLVNTLQSLLDNIEDKEYLDAAGDGAKLLLQATMAIITKGKSLGVELLGELKGYTSEQLQELFFENGGGKNDKHMNLDRKNKAEEDSQWWKEEYKRLRQLKRTPEIKEQMQKAEQKIKHYQGKKDKTGETHSRNAKGNKGPRK